MENNLLSYAALASATGVGILALVQPTADQEWRSTAVLTGYAYETVANKGIETGKTSGPDIASAQPATLGQLALGAEGLFARRREKEVIN